MVAPLIAAPLVRATQTLLLHGGSVQPLRYELRAPDHNAPELPPDESRVRSGRHPRPLSRLQSPHLTSTTRQPIIEDAVLQSTPPLTPPRHPAMAHIPGANPHRGTLWTTASGAPVPFPVGLSSTVSPADMAPPGAQLMFHQAARPGWREWDNVGRGYHPRKPMSERDFSREVQVHPADSDAADTRRFILAKGRHLCAGEVRRGCLSFTIVAHIDGKACGYGNELFNACISALHREGVAVNAIKARWHPTPGLETNFNAFHHAIQQGKSTEEAARHTRTGQYAAAVGLTKPKDIKAASYYLARPQQKVQLRFVQTEAHDYAPHLSPGTTANTLKAWADYANAFAGAHSPAARVKPRQHDFHALDRSSPESQR
jgi:hypothetical protein